MRAIVFWLCLLAPTLAFAQVEITEIMYDLDGTDTGREWLEIHNTSGQNVNVSDLKFFEADTNHKLTPISGDGTLSAGSYAIVADNPDKFKTDWPNFSGLIFDSTFSLSNTGERLEIRLADLTPIDSVTYDPTKGAQGDGKSLQKSGTDWLALVPTLGLASVGESNQNNNPAPQNPPGDPATPVPINQNLAVSPPLKPKIYADAGGDLTAIAGVEAVFSGQAFGVNKEPLANARFIWSFGDGGSTEGKSVVHTYYQPGKYFTFLEVGSGEYSASDKVTVTVISAPISIAEVKFGSDGFISLKNSSNRDIDISFWQLKSADQVFIAPRRTIIPASATIPFATQVTKINVTKPPVYLLYPNTTQASAWDGSVAVKPSESTVSKVVVAPAKPSVNNVPPKTAPVASAPSSLVPVVEAKSQSAEVYQAFNDTYVVTDQKSSNLGYLWFFSLLGLMIVVIGGLLFLRPKAEVNDEEPLPDITILE